MDTDHPKTNTLLHLRFLTLASTIAIFALIVLGGIVRVTGSGGACLDWPTCFGQWTPPASITTTDERAILDYLHRFLTAVVVLLVSISAYKVYRSRSNNPWIKRPITIALGLLWVQVFLGGFVATSANSGYWDWISSLHLGLSLLVQACLLVSTVTIFYPGLDQVENQRLTYRSPFARLSLATLVAIFILLISGGIVAEGQFAAACQSWPLCEGGSLPANMAAWVSFSHRLLVLVVSVFVGVLVWRAWLTQRTQTAILVATTTTGVLYFAQALLGAKLVAGFPDYLVGLHEATAVAVWATMVVQILTVGMAAREGVEEEEELRMFRGRRGLAKDFLLLTKPVVVALLLVTTFAGMVIGAKSWPAISLVFWTLLAGFMAAGGSGAINQYIDRFDDFKMQRTQKRPIPSGRLTPGEGLAFGVGISVASFYLTVAFVNFLAALLLLAGIIYYVLIYSIILKKTTVQNIVIGGGAGAIPPLVGWAAATGSLNVPSLFLFAVIFMWTPPHFWALALVRRKDYARAGVPMLPVVRGEQETRWQIFIYTLELVGLSLLLPLFGLGGSVYLIGAFLLGIWLLSAAWRLWKQGGNKIAWKMYRFSSMYLAFLFAVLMIDALI